MTVKQLIRELSKMPQNLRVGYAHGDNREYEVAGSCSYVMLLDKASYDREELDDEGKSMFDSLPDKIVVIR